MKTNQTINRRTALFATAAGGLACSLHHLGWSESDSRLRISQSVSDCQFSAPQIVHSITPVVGDGNWVWTEQPKVPTQSPAVDTQSFQVEVGVRWTGMGNSRNIASSTVAPIAFPEQLIEHFEIQKSDGCTAEVVPLGDTAAQLQVTAGSLSRGQVIEAKAVYQLAISRWCPRYEMDQFPAKQQLPKGFDKNYLGNSPGIRCNLNSVKKLAKEIVSRHDHPWQMAEKFHGWVWDNIRGIPGAYTSVKAALDNRTGDCEERAGVFIALCRAVGIPARLVWVPNHSWAEFCLVDNDGKTHWIPAHTAAYSWFGWTGAHELVLQKGDRVRQPGKEAWVRLLSDWYTFAGKRPKFEFFASMKPVSKDGQDSKPGERIKNHNGGWDLVTKHPKSRFLRP